MDKKEIKSFLGGLMILIPIGIGFCVGDMLPLAMRILMFICVLPVVAIGTCWVFGQNDTEGR